MALLCDFATLLFSKFSEESLKTAYYSRLRRVRNHAVFQEITMIQIALYSH